MLGTKFDGDVLVAVAIVVYDELLAQGPATCKVAEVEHVGVHLDDDVRRCRLNELVVIQVVEWLKTSARLC